MTELFGLLSGLIILIGAPPYLFDIFKHKTKPQRTTWLIWSVLGIIAFFSQLKLGAHWSLVFVGLSGAGNLIVYGLSLKYGVGGWTKLDKLALVIAAIGVAASYLFRQPLIALLGVVVADFSGTALTIRKTYLSPESETTITWFTFGLAGIFTALAVGHLWLNLLLYPLYLIVTSYGLLIAKYASLAIRRRPTSS